MRWAKKKATPGTDAPNAAAPAEASDDGAAAVPAVRGSGRWWSRRRAQAADVAAQTGPFPHKEATVKKALLVGAAVAVACGPLALLRGSISSVAATPAASTSQSSVEAAQQRQAEWVAAAFLQAWSRTTQTSQATLLTQIVDPPAQVSFPQTAAPAPTSVQIASSVTDRPGHWQITLVASGGSFGAGQWYLVPVVASSTAVAVESLPARVPALNTTPDPTSSTSQIDPTSPPAQTAAGLVSTWLSGGDTATIARWTTQDLHLPSLGQVCRQVSVVGVTASDDDAAALAGAPAAIAESGTPAPSVSASSAGSVHARVSVAVTCTTPTTPTSTRALQYAIGLTNVGGQWAVESVN